tara:strand:+ start:10416 stop:10988 length:573 start_codon:yes stop_codon:yes gene_type:complete
MTRSLNAATKTASQQDNVIEVLFANIQLDTPVYVHTYVGDIEYNSNTYSGVGDFGGVSSIPSGSDLKIENITLSLSGVNNSIISQAIGTDYQYKEITLYLTYMDLSTYTINVPTTIFSGYIDNIEIVSGQTSQITLSAVNKLQALTEPNIRRYNLPDQQSRHPFDVALKYVDQLANQDMVWGKGFNDIRV